MLSKAEWKMEQIQPKLLFVIFCVKGEEVEELTNSNWLKMKLLMNTIRW